MHIYVYIFVAALTLLATNRIHIVALYYAKGTLPKLPLWIHSTGREEREKARRRRRRRERKEEEEEEEKKRKEKKKLR